MVLKVEETMMDEEREMCLAVAGMSGSDGEGGKMFVYFLNAVQTVQACSACLYTVDRFYTGCAAIIKTSVCVSPGFRRGCGQQLK